MSNEVRVTERQREAAESSLRAWFNVLEICRPDYADGEEARFILRAGRNGEGYTITCETRMEKEL